MRKLIILLITFFVMTCPTFANKVGDLSIKELNNNVEKLQNEKETLETQTQLLSQDY